MEKINISKTIKGFAYAAGALVLFTNIALSAEMPKNPRVQSGNVTIEGTGTDHLRIQQSTNKSIINWDSFRFTRAEELISRCHPQNPPR